MTKTDLPRPASRLWAAQISAWDRSLRATNRTWNTRYNYELAATQLADFLNWLDRGAPVTGDTSDADVEWREDWHSRRDDLDFADAAEDPCAVTKPHLEEFIGWMIATRSVATGRNKYRALQQFFRYLEEEEEIDRSPFAKMKQPSPESKLVPILSDDQITALLASCKGRDFVQLRDTAIIRALHDTGARLSELTLLAGDDVDDAVDLLRVDGKGSKQRATPFGAKTALALARYARARAKQPGASLSAFWLDATGREPLQPNGVKIMLKRRGQRVGMPRLHAHQFRHTFAHNWLRAGGNETDLMRIMGWSTRAMVQHYGASAADSRAIEAHRGMAMGDRL
jgi:integrase/recombinase XerC